VVLSFKFLHDHLFTPPLGALSRDHVAEIRLLHKAGDHPFPPNAGGRGGSPAHVGGKATAQLALHHREADEHP
jgi:hypothetical protein